MVEGGSEIVNDVSDSQLNRVGNWFVDAEQQLAPLRLLWVLLGDDFIGFAHTEDAELGFEITDVLFGPFDLPVDAS